MAKKIVLSCVLFALCSSSNSMALPKDLEQFQATGNCLNCDLSSSSLETKYNGALNLEGSNLINSHVYSYSSKRQYSNFTGCTAIKLSLGGGDYSYSHFNNANLKKADLGRLNFTGADFSGADLSGVDFSSANLYQANISEAQLKSVGSLCHAILPSGEIADC